MCGSNARTLGIAAGMLALLTVGPDRLLAHCDALDGPVVTAARRALEQNDVTKVLIWVQGGDETEIRRAFEQTMTVRKLDARARELADMYFFETVVRVHRAGEGAPYTGLKPAGRDLGPAIPAVDSALETGEVEPLLSLLVQAVGNGVRERFAEAKAARNYPAGNVEAGREYIEKYVSLIHYVDGIHRSATTAASEHAEAAEQHVE